MGQEPLISIENIKKYFNVGDGMLKAVDGISFDIYPVEQSCDFMSQQMESSFLKAIIYIDYLKKKCKR